MKLFHGMREWEKVNCLHQHYLTFRSDQIRSVAQSCPTLCDPMNRSTPGLPVHHQLPEFTETHVHRVSDAIQPPMISMNIWLHLILKSCKVKLYIYVYVCVCIYIYGPPWWLSGKESACQCRIPGFDPWVGKISWRRAKQPILVFLPREFRGRRAWQAVIYRGHKESNTI